MGCRFAELTTEDGVPYGEIAEDRGGVLLAPVWAAGRPPTVPLHLAEVAVAAVTLDGVGRLVMTVGAAGPRAVGHLTRCARAVRAAVPGLPIQVEGGVSDDPGALAALARAGVDTLAVRDPWEGCRWAPGAQGWRHAVEVFGPNRVGAPMIVGEEDEADDVVSRAEALVRCGVHPWVIDLRRRADIDRRVGALLAAAGMAGEDLLTPPVGRSSDAPLLEEA